MLKYLKELCELSGISGREDNVREYLQKKAQPHADEIYQDNLGNLFVFKKGKAQRSKKLMVCAHMDEVGIIIKDIDDKGYLKFDFTGGVDRRVVIGKRVLVGDGKIPGIIGVKAVHLSTKEERKNVPKLDEMFIDIGAADKEDAMSVVELGEYAVFDSAYMQLQGGQVKAKAIDDRLGCAIILELIESKPEYDTWFVFTVQEEVGLRGASCAAFSLEPDMALVIESTTAADLPDAEGTKTVCKLKGGAVIGMVDRATIYDRGLFENMKALAKENSIPWQVKTMIAGGTDAGAIHKSRGGVRVTSVSAPVRYIHSPSCVASLEDINAVYELAKAFVNSDTE